VFRKILDHFLNKDEQRRIDTEFYPDPVSSRGKDDFPAKARGLVFNEIERCTGCGECVKVCPTQCIELTTEANEKNEKLRVITFNIDFSNCIFCGLCVDHCDPQSLSQTKEVQPAVFNPKDLIMSFGRGKL
jgi:formate hydrogenlyase subunit 6/NADH:ubiquinone oxidoreductase subunit I